MYEVFMQLIWRGFKDWFEEENFPEYQELDTMLSNINNLRDNDLDSRGFNEILENDVSNAIHERFQQYLNKLRRDNGTMSASWMSYIDLISLILDFIRASREKDWTLHLISNSNLMPWCFAYNRSNYARYLPWYLMQVLTCQRLTQTFISIYQMKISPHKLRTTIHLVVLQWIKQLKKLLTKILRLLVALKDSVQKKMICQGIISQPIKSILR